MTLPLKYSAIEVPDDDPFRHDAFDRKKLVEPLTSLVASVTHPFVFAVTAPWGYGKTTFLRQWIATLKPPDWSTITFNAWQNDFTDSALATMIAELQHGVLKIREMHKGKVATAANKIKKASLALGKRLLPAAAKGLTLGALDVDKALEGVAAEAAGTIAADFIDGYAKAKESIGAFKTALQELVEALRDSETPSRLVIFVDELDRCRPPFALEMLEVMKHLFDVDGVVFVLALDISQLTASVTSVYGQGIDGREYLRRLIDMQFALPTPTPKQIVSSLWSHSGLDDLRKVRVPHRVADDMDTMREVLDQFAELIPRSVRFQEHLMARLCAVARMTYANQYLFSEVLVFLLYLRELNHQAYERFVRNGLSPHEAMSQLLQDRAAEFQNSNLGTWLEGRLLIAMTSNNRSFVSEYEQRLKVAPEGDEKQRLIRILEVVSNSHRSHGFLRYVVPKIELTDRFVDPTQAQPHRR